jgi:hypothetical protein
VAQGVGPEIKPQHHHQKKKKNEYRFGGGLRKIGGHEQIQVIKQVYKEMS